MALDPSISLDVRPPQFNVQIPQPLQQFGQILSLQNLMQEGQMGQLKLQQAQEEWRQRQELSKLLFSPQVSAPQAGTAESPALPVPPQAAAPPLTVGGMMGPSGAAFDPSASVLSPVFPAVSAPPQAAPSVTGESSPTTAPPVAVRPTGQIQTPGQIGIPDFQKWFQVAPLIAPQMADTYLKSIKSAYDVQNAAATNQQNVLKRAAGLANTIVDEPTKITAISNALREGIISPQERDRLLQVKFDDPIWKSWQQGALTGAEGLQNQRDQIRLHMEQLTKAYEFAKAPYELSSAQSAAKKAGTEADVAQRNEDASRLIAAASQGPEQLNKAFAALPTPERQAPFAGANTPEEIYYRLHPEQRPSVAGAKAGAEDLARKTAEAQFYAPTTASVLSGKTRLQDVDPAIQKIIMPALIQGGYGQQGTPTEATGGQFGKLISDAEREHLGDYDRAKTVLQNTLNLIKGYVPDKEGKDTNQKTEDYMGPVEGLKAYSPWATLHKNVQSALVTQQQQLKKFITNGSLRGLTEKTLGEMFPAVTSTPEHATSVINQLMKTVEDEKQAYLRDLSDKVIPASLKNTATPPAPAALQPPSQTIEKTGAAGPRVTGSFTIGGGAITAPPGKIVVQAPASRGGGQYFLDSDKWPQYQKQGFTRAE